MFHLPSLNHPTGHVDVHFPTAPCSSLTPRTDSNTSRSFLTSIKPADATPQVELRLGSLSKKPLLTGYEPRFDSENDSSHLSSSQTLETRRKSSSISSRTSSPKTVTKFNNPAEGKQQQALFSPVSTLVRPRVLGNKYGERV